MKGVLYPLSILVFIAVINAFLWESCLSAELAHKWKSPSFSGIGFSAHALTIGESCGTTYTTGTVDGVVTTSQNTVNPEIGNTDGVGSNCTGTYSFNDTTVTYTKDVTNDIVTLDIVGPDGSQVITLPLNDFQF